MNNLVGGLYNLDMLENLEKGKTVDVEIEKIVENNLNNIYDKRPLDDLKESIVKDGLLQPLVAYKEGSNYVLVSGHHRLAAIKELLKENKQVIFFGKEVRDTVPLLVHKGFKDKNEELLVLLHSNIGRRLTDKETERISKEIIRIDEEMYPSSASKPRGTKRERIEKISPISAKTIERHIKEPQNEYDEVMSKLKSITKYIDHLDLNKFANMERLNIKNQLSKLSERIYEK